jgi:PAS domain S-box-containing protein
MENTEEIDALFRFAAEGILIIDQHGIIVRINPSAEQLFGYEKDELLHQRIEVLIPGHFKEKHEKHRQEYMTVPRGAGDGERNRSLRLEKRRNRIACGNKPEPVFDQQGKICDRVYRR